MHKIPEFTVQPLFFSGLWSNFAHINSSNGVDSSLTPGLYTWLAMDNPVFCFLRVFARYVELKYTEIIK